MKLVSALVCCAVVVALSKVDGLIEEDKEAVKEAVDTLVDSSSAEKDLVPREAASDDALTETAVEVRSADTEVEDEQARIRRCRREAIEAEMERLKRARGSDRRCRGASCGFETSKETTHTKTTNPDNSQTETTKTTETTKGNCDLGVADKISKGVSKIADTIGRAVRRTSSSGSRSSGSRGGEVGGSKHTEGFRMWTAQILSQMMVVFPLIVKGAAQWK